MANRLLRYEWALFRNSFADAFARKRDRLLLALVVTFALLWLSGKLSSFALPGTSPHAFWLAALAVLPAFAWHRQLMTRLAWLSEYSALAPAAIERRSRRAYLLAAHSLIAVPLLIGAAVFYQVEGLVVATVAYALGLGIANVIPIRIVPRDAPTHRRAVSIGRAPMLRAILRRQTLGSARPGPAALMIVAAVFVLTAASIWLSRDLPGPIRLATPILPALLALLVAGRLDAALIGFLPYAGRRALTVGLAISVLPAAGFAAAGAAILVIRPPESTALLSILSLLHLVFIIAGLERAWLYPGRYGRSVDLQVQIEFAGLALIVLMLPPFALAALAWRLWSLQRRYSRFVWLHP